MAMSFPRIAGQWGEAFNRSSGAKAAKAIAPMYCSVGQTLSGGDAAGYFEPSNDAIADWT
jgi:hypothetical protein